MLGQERLEFLCLYVKPSHMSNSSVFPGLAELLDVFDHELCGSNKTECKLEASSLRSS